MLTMKYIFFTFLFIYSVLHAETIDSYTDNFSTDTISLYITENTWTAGGTGGPQL